MSSYIIKTITREQLDEIIAWAAAEGWNPGLHDADCFYQADPSGFLGGFLEGEAIASISAVKYGTEFGFLGFYMVKPEFRGQGYGFKIWQAGLATLEGRTIGLDGVVDQQSNYLKSGFELAYRNIRYEGISFGHESPMMAANLVSLSSLPIADVLGYDAPFFPDDRRQFLRCWITQPDSYGVGLLHHNQLVGYGVLRRCHQGFKMGPLLADAPEFAATLFNALKAKVPGGSPFYLDVPEVNKAAVSLAEQNGLKSIFETARMYTPRIPQLPLERIFGVTTFELG